MTISINYANNQASRIYEQINKLNQSKSQLLTYKSSLSSCWSGTETQYLFNSIDSSISKIDSIIVALKSLSNSVRSTAATIKREDDEAAARAKAARIKAQKLEKARKDYNESVKKYKDKVSKINFLKAEHNSSKNKARRAELRTEIEKLQNELKNDRAALDAKKQLVNSLKK